MCGMHINFELQIQLKKKLYSSQIEIQFDTSILKE